MLSAVFRVNELTDAEFDLKAFEMPQIVHQ